MSERVGLWFVGAHGGVSTTVAVGLHALSTGDQSVAAGLVSQLPQFGHLPLVDWSNIVIGGHDIRDTGSAEEALKLATVSRAFDGSYALRAADFLKEFDSSIRPGIVLNVGDSIRALAADGRFQPAATPAAAIAAIQADLKEFQQTHSLDRVVMVNLASTEPPLDCELPPDWESLKQQLDSSDLNLPASSMYAIAALDAGIPFVNFTPSTGSCPPAIDQLARMRNTCHSGHDGKTGETFMKSVLAPAFAKRNLDIMSWVGHNIFGNMDGQILDDPINKETKVVSKDKLLGEILGYDPQTHISIEYIRSLGDWKTAWDHIHFRGFLGTPMILQFTWQGCDSILAAPLVLDLVRFTELASRRGESGLLTWLSSFYKSPLGTKENDFAVQFSMLERWASEYKNVANQAGR